MIYENEGHRLENHSTACRVLPSGRNTYDHDFLTFLNYSLILAEKSIMKWCYSFFLFLMPWCLPVLLQAEEVKAKFWVLSDLPSTQTVICADCDLLRNLSDDVYNSLKEFGISHKIMDEQLQSELTNLLISKDMSFSAIGEIQEIDCQNSTDSGNEESFDSFSDSMVLKAHSNKMLKEHINKIHLTSGKKEIIMIRGKSHGEDVLVQFHLSAGKVKKMSYYSLHEVKIIEPKPQVEPEKAVGVEVIADKKQNYLKSNVILQIDNQNFRVYTESGLHAKGEQKLPQIGQKVEVVTKLSNQTSLTTSGSYSTQLNDDPQLQTVTSDYGVTMRQQLSEDKTLSIGHKFEQVQTGDTKNQTNSITMGYESEPININSIQSESRLNGDEEITRSQELGVELNFDATNISVSYQHSDTSGDLNQSANEGAILLNSHGISIYAQQRRDSIGEDSTINKNHSVSYEGEAGKASIEINDVLENGIISEHQVSITGAVNIGKTTYQVGHIDAMTERQISLELHDDIMDVILSRKKYKLSNEMQWRTEAGYHQDNWYGKVYIERDKNTRSRGIEAGYEDQNNTLQVIAETKSTNGIRTNSWSILFGGNL